LIKLNSKELAGYILVYADKYVLFAIDISGEYNNDIDSGGIYLWYMPERKNIFDLANSNTLKITGVDEV